MATHTFKREELYELVWSEPMARLATVFGISDRGLAKACAKVNVPVPGRGYWARIAAGYKPKRSILPPRKPGEPASVTISPLEPAPLPPPPAPSVQGKIDEEKRTENKVVVPDTLRNPHPLIEAWLRADKEDRSRARIGGWPYEPLQNSDLAKRRLRILSALFKALEARGYSVSSESRGHKIDVSRDFEVISLELQERIRQFRRYLSEEEKARSLYPRKWAQEKEPTGELQLRIGSRYWLNHEWRDTPDKPIEDQINDVLGGIAATFEELRLRREKELAEAERRRKAEEERQRREREKQQEKARFDRLVDKINDWHTASVIRQFVNAVTKSRALSVEIRTSESFVDWKEWALKNADRIDPLQADNPIE